MGVVVFQNKTLFTKQTDGLISSSGCISPTLVLNKKENKGQEKY